MRCPLCINETLDAHHRGGIEIDVCPRCRGIWLDRGELDKLVDDAGDRAPAPTRTTDAAPDRRASGDRDRDDRDRDEKKHKKKRKKSKAERLVEILEDVFD